MLRALKLVKSNGKNLALEQVLTKTFICNKIVGAEY